MKRNIKRIISFALVMTFLLSTMITVSAEGTIAAENFSVEDELMPMSADYCGSGHAYGFTPRTYTYYYVTIDSTIYAVLRLVEPGEDPIVVTIEPNWESDLFIQYVQDAMSYYMQNITYQSDLYYAWNGIRGYSIMNTILDYDSFDEEEVFIVIKYHLIEYNNNSSNPDVPVESSAEILTDLFYKEYLIYNHFDYLDSNYNTAE